MLGGLGFVDTLNETAVNHHSGLIASLSNPYAAMPSLHTAYALIVGASAVCWSAAAVLRVLWAFYPALVVFSIVATANHFFLDAAGGAGVAMLAALAVVRGPHAQPAACGCAGGGAGRVVPGLPLRRPGRPRPPTRWRPWPWARWRWRWPPTWCRSG